MSIGLSCGAGTPLTLVDAAYAQLMRTLPIPSLNLCVMANYSSFVPCCAGYDELLGLAQDHEYFPVAFSV